MSRPWLTALLVGALTAALYVPRLSRAPIYLSPDEVFTAVQAHSIATTGRDAGGRFLPFYIEYRYPPTTDASGTHPGRSGWLPPIIYYSIALMLKVLPVSEASVRLPTIFVGVLDVVLIYFVGRRLFKNEGLAILGAVLLALTPAHFMFSRFALDYIYPLPFVLGWMLCLFAYLEDGRAKQLFTATLLLGIGIFSYIASALHMPICFLLTLAALARDRRPAKAYGVAVLGFALPAALIVIWAIAHPLALKDVLWKYDLVGSSEPNALQSLRGLLTFHRIGDQLSRWWAFFNPRFLFFNGPMEPMFSTREIGVFTLPMAAFLLLGLRASLRQAAGAATLVLLAGFVFAPLPATLVIVTDAIYRTLALLPFVILLGVGGVAYLWSTPLPTPPRRVLIATGVLALVVGAVYAMGMLALRSRMPGAAVPTMVIGSLALAAGLLAGRWRISQVIAAALLAIVPIQFGTFYGDYLTDYQHRVSLAFSGNIRGAFEDVMREDRNVQAPVVYLASMGQRGDLAWTFYLAKYHREELSGRTRRGAFDVGEILRLPPGSLIVTNGGEGQTDATVERLVGAGDVSRTVIREPNGTPTFLVLRRQTGS
jgi:4-amino-4-deoxy-L-arabinose transferase-like glycosyltransferase